MCIRDSKCPVPIERVPKINGVLLQNMLSEFVTWHTKLLNDILEHNNDILEHRKHKDMPATMAPCGSIGI